MILDGNMEINKRLKINGNGEYVDKHELILITHIKIMVSFGIWNTYILKIFLKNSKKVGKN